MFNMDGWDVAVALIAGYVAVTTLVRLMIAKRDAVVERLRGEIEAEQARQKQAEKQAAAQASQKPRGRGAA